MSAASAHHHYNPDWLSDDALLANFVARQEEFSFLRNELARAPLVGTVQHHLLVGLRGAGKTTLLKRLAISIRRDSDLKDHLIALSFPEELYQVKNLADFWWAACDALADELEHLDQGDEADCLIAAMEKTKGRKPESSDSGYKLLLQTCANLKRRPVLLVDNLDFIFQRIDKKGRKLQDPHAAAYWELRESLSTTTSPIAIGGSVRLSEPFTGYDKAFYDFFIPKRLGKLSLPEVRTVLERLADAQGMPEIKQRLSERPSRIESLFELTGGNPRALGLIFELLRLGPNSRAVEDFERLMDITTPYYKARFEDLSEQAQVVMHALAVRRPGDGGGLRYGHTAAEIGTHAGLPTGTVSAQLDILEREGLVEKSSAHGRTQYRIAEQLFRLWLQMRSTRRIRQNVIGLTEFLEAMFDFEELHSHVGDECGAAPMSDARYAFAVAGAARDETLRKGLEAYGADRLLQHLKIEGGDMADYLSSGDLPEEVDGIMRLREQLQKCKSGLSNEELDALLGSLELKAEQKQASVQALCKKTSAKKEAGQLRSHFDIERQKLLQYGLQEQDLPLLYSKRALGLMPLPSLTPQDAEATCIKAKDQIACRAMIWRLVGAHKWVDFANNMEAQKWLDWGFKHAENASSTEWANVAGAMRYSGKITQAQQALDKAFSLGESAQAWYEQATLLFINNNANEAVNAYLKAIEIEPKNIMAWQSLGALLTFKTERYAEAADAFRKVIELDPSNSFAWRNLGSLLAYKLQRFDEAEIAYRKSLEIESADSVTWRKLGDLLADKLNRFADAETAYRKAIEITPSDVDSWSYFGDLLANKLDRFDEAETAYRKAIEIDPSDVWPWNSLGDLYAKLGRFDEAETAYRKAIEIDPSDVWPWNGLGEMLTNKSNRFIEAEAAFRKAIELDTSFIVPWLNLGVLLETQDRLDEASATFAQAATLDVDIQPWWQKHHAVLQIRISTNATRKALEANNRFELRNALSHLLAESSDIAASLVSTHFVEEFLIPMLKTSQHAQAVLDTMRELGYEKHARPMLLAFEAALLNRAEMLDELEPEIQGAAKRMFERLMGKPRKQKKAIKQSKGKVQSK